MKLLIVDDERAILESVYEQLCEMKLEVESIQMANGTREARELMEKEYFDIYLCDIVMPEEDGITFAKWVLEQYKDIKFIFLTAHADYNYMKEAISMQSFDYLLQPASKEDLKNVVERAISQIKIEAKNRELMRVGTFFSGYEENILEDGALKYLRGESEESIYLKRLISLRYKEKYELAGSMPVMVQVLHSQKNLDQIPKALRRSIYYNIVDEIIGPLNMKSVLMLTEGENGNFFIVLCAKNEEEPERASILERLETMRIFFEKLIQTRIAVYCGEYGTVNGLKENSYYVMQEQDNNIRKESRVFSVGKYKKKTVDYSFEAQIAPWKKLLEQKKFLEFQKSVFKYMEQHAKNDDMNQEYMMKLHCLVSELILGYMVHLGMNSDAVFDEQLPYFAYMSSWKTLESFQNAMDYIVNKLQNLVGMPETDEVQLAIKYIRQNMEQDVAVSEIAEYVGMNPEYFTKLFKKKTGYTLKEYIANEKINTAKMLLTTTDLPVTLISDHVGYGNYSNFTRSFKQLVGCTPTEYRKQAEEQQG